MNSRYDIYLSGKLAEGTTPAAAAASLARLFRTTPAAMAALITGKPQLLKRDVDRATAARYREALLQAGVMVAFRQLAPANAAAPASATAAASSAPAAAADAPPPAVAPTSATGAAPGLALAAEGEELLRPDERSHPAPVQVDTRGYQLSEPGELPPPARAAAPPPPATDHLQLLAAEGNLLSEAERTTPPLMAASAGDFTLAPAGELLETLPTAAAPVDPDTDHLSLAPAGDDLLPDRERPAPPPPPSTDHLGLV